MKIRNQAQFLYEFNKNNKIPFNEKLFDRNMYDTVEALKKTILNFQRKSEKRGYSVVVSDFELIEDYNRINQILSELFEEKNKNNNNRKKSGDNPYSCININDTYSMMLMVYYTITVGKEVSHMKIPILIPIIVDKYYYKIDGNYYYPMIKVSETCTYNNSTSSHKNDVVTLSLPASPFKTIKDSIYLYDALSNNEVHCVMYMAYIYNKKYPSILLLLYKYGLIGTMIKLGIEGIVIDNKPANNEMYYSFNRDNIYINVPKYLYHRDLCTQAFISCIYVYILNNTTVNNIYTNKYWTTILCQVYGNTGNTIKKRKKSISSVAISETKLEGIILGIERLYVSDIKDNIYLPEKDKETFYDIIIWIIREFKNLMNKDNLDFKNKRIEINTYLSTFYSYKMNTKFRVFEPDNIKKDDELMKELRGLYYVQPSIILDNIVTSNIVSHRNMTNDIDAIQSLKFTTKPLKYGKNKTSSPLPTGSRMIHPSHQNIVDMFVSSKSDPGITGVFTPYIEIKNGRLTDEQEPNQWNGYYNNVYNNYLEKNKKIKLFKNINKNNNTEIADLDELYSDDDIELDF